MFPILKRSEVRKMLPRREPTSHKGDNGRVLIIGGSQDYFGAPILSALGSLYSGADLTYLLVPECNFDVTRSFYPDFIVRHYGGHYLNLRGLDEAIKLSEQCDAILIGPGLGKNPDSLDVVCKLLARIKKPIVLDAEALAAPIPRDHPSITITPHMGEIGHMADRLLKTVEQDEKEKLLADYAKETNVTILLKGPEDAIVTPEGFGALNATGHPGMTVGGTGDVLSGMVASFIAQGLKPFEACCAGAFVSGFVGETLAKQKGNCFSATDVALELAYVINSL